MSGRTKTGGHVGGGCLLLAFSVFISLDGYATAAAPATGLEAAFETKGTRWTSEMNRFAAPRFVDNKAGKGYEFNCDFALADPKYPRSFWDAELPTAVDLSKAASIVMNVRFTHWESARFFCLYLKSNGKWFLSRYYDMLGEGANSVVFQIPDYRMEGTASPSNPKLLNHVTEIRVNVFPKEGLKTKPTLATVTGVRVSATRVEGYRNLPLFQVPDEDKGLTRAHRRDPAGRLLESRAIFDGGSKFLQEGADAVLDGIQRAGFNVYVPCVWHGRGAIYRSKSTAVEPRFAACFKGAADPTAEMIEKAHARGVEVHAWFCVAYRGEPDPHPEFTAKGLPTEGGYLTPYDLQDPAFRDFIVKEIVTFAADYDVDGINLDYIRTIGISFSKIARALYAKKYGAYTDDGTGAASALTPLKAVFETEGTTWTSETYKFAAPRYVNDRLGKGYEFPCDFPRADPQYPRCIWDAKLATPADLTRADSIAMDVRFTNPGAVKFLCFYLKSHGKWYLSHYYGALGQGTNRVSFQLCDYRLDGTARPCTPESLNHVEEIRVNVFPKDGLATKPTVATVTGVHVNRSKIDELKGDMSPEVGKRFLQWQEEAVSDIVRRVSEGVRRVKPKAIISVDGHPLAKPQLEKQGRNEWIWLEKKWIDIAFCMDYGWRPNFRAYQQAANASACPKQCVLLLGDYDQESRKAFPRNAEQVARLVDYTLRKYPDYGTAIFDYCYLTDVQVKALRDGPFKEDAVPCWPGR